MTPKASAPATVLPVSWIGASRLRSLDRHSLFQVSTSTALVEGVFHVESDLHIAIPQTAGFLQADLSGDAAEALRIAESPRP